MSNRAECMIRLDDITPDMDWERFNRVKQILDKYQIRPLIGVVPDNKDENLHKGDNKEDFWNTIRALQSDGWAVAQHGTYHCYETQNAGILRINPFSEFAGLSYEEQLRKVQDGRRILEQNGIVTDIFMAPGHTYDNNTLKALYECGFRVITDGLFHKPYYDKKILFVPCRLREFRKPSGIDTVCLHTNLMSEEDRKELAAFCEANKDVIVSFDPKRYSEQVGKKTIFVKIEERLVLAGRLLKDKIAHSKRLAWYMNKTNHRSSKVKWLKRLVCLPMLLCYSKEK